MGGCGRQASDSFWTFFYFPLLSLDTCCHHALCRAALVAHNLPDEGELQP